MADTFESRTITVRIARPRRDVYDFTAVPENFPRWASGLGRSLKSVDGEWISDNFGVLDHHVDIRPGVDIYIPMRVIANGSGREVILTLG
jgi:uncharacterized protein YndB with AHSA1/START domain